MKLLYTRTVDDTDTVELVAQWRSDSALLAVAGSKRKVTIFDRAGTNLADINLPDADIDYDKQLNCVLTLEWHSSGKYLAILPRGQHFAMVWNSITHEVARVDADIKPVEACFMTWKPSKPQLLLGSARGSALIFDCITKSILRLQAKLNRAICCGKWFEVHDPNQLRSFLVLGSKDQHISWFDPEDGSLLKFASLRGVPVQIDAFVDQMHSSTFLSANVGKHSILLWQLPLLMLPDSPGPMELSFQERYGEVEHHSWLDGSMLLAGFQTGQIAIVKLCPDQPNHGTEVYSHRLLPYSITGLSVYASSQQVAMAGGRAVGLLQWSGAGNAIKIDSEWAELDKDQNVSQVIWSPDGQLLTITTKGGKFHQYIVRVPTLLSIHHSTVAYTSSIADVTVVDLKSKKLPACLHLKSQPRLLSLGPLHLASINANTISFYSLKLAADGLTPPPMIVEFGIDVKDCQLNETHAVVLGNSGQIYLQPLTLNLVETLVELRDEQGVACHAASVSITKRHIIVGMSSGNLAFYQCQGGALENEFHHAGGAVELLYPDFTGTKVLIQDAQGLVNLYQASTNYLIHPPEFEGALEGVLWHTDDPNLVVLFSSTGSMYCYVFIPNSVAGPGMKLLGTQSKPHGHIPLILQKQFLTCRLPAGDHRDVELDAFIALKQDTSVQQQQDSNYNWKDLELESLCLRALSVCHLSEALCLAKRCGKQSLLQEVAETALHLLDIAIAAEAYEAAGDTSTAMQLRPLAHTDDPNLLAGKVLAILGDYDGAKELFLSSSDPVQALELTIQLEKWDEVASLCQILDPGQAGLLCMGKAQLLQEHEQENRFDAAAALYHNCLGNTSATTHPDITVQCKAGIARCSIQSGNVCIGVKYAVESNSHDLCVQCAQWLCQRQEYRSAADLYLAAEQYDKAAEMYLNCKEFSFLNSIIDKISDHDIRLRYAEVLEDLGSYLDCARLYQEGGCPKKAVMVCLTHLKDVQAALRFADSCPEAALCIAKYCRVHNDFKLAVEHFCKAEFWGDAFIVAKEYGELEAFCACVKATQHKQQAVRLADYFEIASEFALAAEFAGIGQLYERAACLYLKAGDGYVKEATSIAAASHDQAAVTALLQHLQTTEGMEDHLFKLHSSLGHSEQACAIAVAKASADQRNGNYKLARDYLLNVCAQLQDHDLKATPGLLQSLMLLQSYLLVKTMVRVGDHVRAARLLLRIADNIMEFPKHVVPILTSTVIECHRAQLHLDAHKWAMVLMEPQNFPFVAEPYKKKIASIATQPSRMECEPLEAYAECLFCSTLGPEAETKCSKCCSVLPMCFATGLRFKMTDASQCPNCHFPCRGTDLSKLVGKEGVCPACEQHVAIHSIKRILDPHAYLRRTIFSSLFR